MTPFAKHEVAWRVRHLGERDHRGGCTHRIASLRAAPFGRLLQVRHEVHDLAQAWALVKAVDRPALGLAVDSFHMLARGTDAAVLASIGVERVFLVQLADCLAPSLETNE